MRPELVEIISHKSALLFEKVRNYRRHIHMHPELSYQETETMRYVSDTLKQLKIPHQCPVGDTGVVAIIHGDHHGSNDDCIALRADLDALPIKEETNAPYKSTRDGIMHACGHDVHTSILLGTAEILNDLRNELPLPVKLIFQPGEEKNPGGATLMIRDGVLSEPEVKEIYALHVFPDMPVGEAGFREGLYMASCDEIYITIFGKGGHAATPEKCVDPIVIGANIVTKLQEIVSKRSDPGIPTVLSIGHFEAQGATNIIPDKAYLKGTFRTMDEVWRKEAHVKIKALVSEIAARAGGNAEVEISVGYPFLFNDPSVTAKMKRKAQILLGKENVSDLPLRLTSEDFSYYSQQVPACFFRLGVRNESRGIIHGVHHPKFDVDEEALIVGMQLMASAAFD